MTYSPLNHVLDKFISKGMVVIPIQPNTPGLAPKAPGFYVIWTKTWSLMSDWQKFVDAPLNPLTIQQWKTWPNANVGLPLGGVNNVIALDFDYDINGLHEQIESIAGVSPCKKKGAKGFTAFYRFNGEKSYKWNLEKQSIVELLSKGRQTVIPPSIHPDGMAYEWIGTPLYEIDINDLPQLPEDFKQQVDKLIHGDQEERETAGVSFLWENPADEDVVDALNFIDPSCGYEDWVQIGMALQNHFGERGLSLWDTWSSKSDKYPDSKTIQTKWKSFKPNHGITIKTLFKQARLNGYIKTSEFKDEPVEIDLSDAFLKKIEEAKGNSLPAPIFHTSTDFQSMEIEFGDYSEVLNPPSQVLKDIIQWIEAVSIKPQRIYSMAAALCGVGLVLGHRIQSYTGLRSNLFCVTIGESGSGKDRPMKAIDHLLTTCQLSDHIGGVPKSGPAILVGVKNAKGRILYQIDEFGMYLSGLTSKYAQGYQGEILKQFMALNTSAMGIYRGDDRADLSKSPKAVIDSPHVVINGVTTPSMFWSSLNSRHSVNGFLNRIILFESDIPSIPEQIPADMFDVPEHLQTYISEFNSMPTNVEYGKGNVANLNIRPAKVDFTEKAHKSLKDFKKFCEEKRLLSINLGTEDKELWVRAPEQAQKLALCCYEHKDIDVHVMDWACALSRISVTRMVQKVNDLVADTQYEGDNKKVFAIIKQSGKEGIPQWLLSQKTRWVNGREREQIVRDLLEQNLIVARKEVNKLNKPGKPGIWFIAV